MVKDKLIVALDFHTKEDALALVDKLGDSVVFYKVGMELSSNLFKELNKLHPKIHLMTANRFDVANEIIS